MHNNFKETEKKGNYINAAAYVRMSTDQQKFSTDNQLQFINSYAKKHNYKVVEIFKDDGVSGLQAKGREGFLALIEKVESGKANFSTILVYDVSRWGRFQNRNEGASYLFKCESSGINVIFCAEPFTQEKNSLADIGISIQQYMAAMYSKNLSEKVFLGQANLIQRGFRQGGPAGFGLRRQLIDSKGTTKLVLSQGERKSIQTDRIILIPGPQEELDVVHFIYDSFVNKKLGEQAISDQLNQKSLKTDMNREWTRGVVHQILINEKYVGHNVWNRRSFKLKEKHVHNKPDKWVRTDNAFEPIISQDLFNKAQTIIIARSHKLSNSEMLEHLQELRQKHGKLSGIIIDEADGPSSSAYQSRFGSLLKSYKLIDYHPERDYQYIEINRILRTTHPTIVQKIIEQIHSLGGAIIVNTTNDLLTINNEFTASLILSRCQQTKTGSLRWIIRLDTGLSPDLSIVARMSICAQEILDYYLLPALYLETPKLKLLENNPAYIEIFRFDSLATFYQMTKRITLKEMYFDKKL